MASVNNKYKQYLIINKINHNSLLYAIMPHLNAFAAIVVNDQFTFNCKVTYQGELKVVQNDVQPAPFTLDGACFQCSQCTVQGIQCSYRTNTLVYACVVGAHV